MKKENLKNIRITTIKSEHCLS